MSLSAFDPQTEWMRKKGQMAEAAKDGQTEVRREETRETGRGSLREACHGFASFVLLMRVGC